ncbi:MAG: 4-(cytidine 5'-diphospho)-2-C-methyl-D-erythritol kinase [Pseudomonadota bacterium]
MSSELARVEPTPFCSASDLASAKSRFDDIEIEVTADGSLSRTESNSPVAPQSDLMLKAAKWLKERYQVSQGARFGIHKRIPIGGGLGGGSSDAATCLLALNRLWGLDLSLDELAQAGSQLGADVAVFVRGEAAWAEGVGELLEPIDLRPEIYLLIDPKVSVSTAEIFAAEELTRTNDPLTIRAFLQDAGHNVCVPVVRMRYPAVAEALDWLGNFTTARMSGTGACVFGSFDSLEAAEEVKSRVPENWVSWVVNGLNRSPVHQQLGLLT